MPRAKPFRCHTCGTLYTGGRCPKCHPKRSKRQGAGWGHGGGRGRRSAAQVLGRGELPVNVDTVGSIPAYFQDTSTGVVPSAADEGANGVCRRRPIDGTCTTESELQVQGWDGGAARSSGAPLIYG